jgi:hypothetical protein
VTFDGRFDSSYKLRILSEHRIRSLKLRIYCNPHHGISFYIITLFLHINQGMEVRLKIVKKMEKKEASKAERQI